MELDDDLDVREERRQARWRQNLAAELARLRAGVVDDSGSMADSCHRKMSSSGAKSITSVAPHTSASIRSGDFFPGTQWHI